MTRDNAAYFGIGVVAGSAVTALLFLIKEGFIFVGEDAPIQRETNLPEEITIDSEKPVAFKDVQPTTVETIAYNDIVKSYNGKEEPPMQKDMGVYTITEDEFFESLGIFDIRYVTLYSDGVIVNTLTGIQLEQDDVATALGSLYTPETLKRMFDKGADTVYIRNEHLFTQYEITYDDEGGGDLIE